MSQTITETKQYYLSPSGIIATKKNGFFNSSILFNLPNFINENKSTIYNTIKISHLEIPYSFYVINETNNRLVVNNQVLNIEFGNYNATTLLNAINGLFIESSINASISFKSSNGKYTLTSPSNITINSTSTINKIIGLDIGAYNGIFNGSTFVINFPYPVNCSGIKNILVKSNLFTNNIDTFNGDSTILKSIPVNVPPYGIIMYSNYENTETFVKNRNLNILEIDLVDETHNYINFNNIDWSICIELRTTKEIELKNLTIDEYFENLNTPVNAE